MTFRETRGVSFFLQNVKALLARLLFAIHGMVAIWKVWDVREANEVYLLCLPLVLLVVEMGLTTFFTKQGEWKWFCPSVFLYLASVIPGIWLLHMDMYHTRHNIRTKQGVECEEVTITNATALQDIHGISIPLVLSAEEWTSSLQQIMFVMLVIGRWLLPKGDLTRDQLSQLLLTYLGIAADSLEFSLDTLDIGPVRCNRTLIITVLTLWTWSMMQFTFVRWSTTRTVKTSTGGAEEPKSEQKPRLDCGSFCRRQRPESNGSCGGNGNRCQQLCSKLQMGCVTHTRSVGSKLREGCAKPMHERCVERCTPVAKKLNPKGCCGSEIWSLFVTVMLQDAPFLLMRMYLIIKFHVVNQMMLFFVIKNSLVISLQLYRAIIICGRSAEINELIDADAKVENAEETEEVVVVIEGGLNPGLEEQIAEKEAHDAEHDEENGSSEIQNNDTAEERGKKNPIVFT